MFNKRMTAFFMTFFCLSCLPFFSYAYQSREVKNAGNIGGTVQFTGKAIPPGTYTVSAWHEALGKVHLANVKVKAGKPAI